MSLILGEWRWDGRMLLAGCLPCMPTQPRLRECFLWCSTYLADSRPFEITAASLTIQYWNSTLSPAIFISIFLVVIIIIQIFGVRGYGEGKSFFGPYQFVRARTENPGNS